MSAPAKKHELHHLYMSYVIGFVLSLIITLVAFILTMRQIDADGQDLASGVVIAILAILAISQLVVQLLFFFHLGSESKPRLNTVSFLFMLMVIGILGLGSLWIMYNLDYNMMPRDVEQHMMNEENIHPTEDHADYNHNDHE